jgi:hypothetical protein
MKLRRAVTPSIAIGSAAKITLDLAISAGRNRLFRYRLARRSTRIREKQIGAACRRRQRLGNDLVVPRLERAATTVATRSKASSHTPRINVIAGQ